MRIPRAGNGTVRSVIVALAFAGAATALAALPDAVSTTSAALVYVLAVTGASAIGGLIAGLVASVLSFLGLNFFFTEPFHTFSVAKTQDLIALATFLLVSVTVGTLLSTAVAQRSRAERRGREAVLLQRLGARLLSGESLGHVLGSFADAVIDLFPVGRCEITTQLTAEPTVAEHAGASPLGEPVVIPMAALGQDVGHIALYPASGETGIGQDERRVVEAFANQMGLAIESARLGSEAAQARLDAETNRTRAALFSSVTHDLRTPLASITASVTSLLDGSARFSEEDRRELLETIRHEADRLNRLVGNLLDLSRLRAGALVPHAAPAALDEVIEGVVARLQRTLEGHEIRLLLREDLPDVAMDVVQIDQVLTNLLENAARFSPAGRSITIVAGRWQDDVEVRVIDHGPGIPPADRDRAFEPFVGGVSGATGGTGLGLSISRAIVEAHGGRIWIEGTPGGGTTVVFRLPARTR